MARTKNHSVAYTPPQSKEETNLEDNSKSNSRTVSENGSAASDAPSHPTFCIFFFH